VSLLGSVVRCQMLVHPRVSEFPLAPRFDSGSDSNSRERAMVNGLSVKGLYRDVGDCTVTADEAAKGLTGKTFDFIEKADRFTRVRSGSPARSGLIPGRRRYRCQSKVSASLASSRRTYAFSSKVRIDENFQSPPQPPTHQYRNELRITQQGLAVLVYLPWTRSNRRGSHRPRYRASGPRLKRTRAPPRIASVRRLVFSRATALAVRLGRVHSYAESGVIGCRRSHPSAVAVGLCR
jgi:hypothetical protein